MSLLFASDDGDSAARFSVLLSSSGKLDLMDKMVARLVARGHRVLIYSQVSTNIATVMGAPVHRLLGECF